MQIIMAHSITNVDVKKNIAWSSSCISTGDTYAHHYSETALYLLMVALNHDLTKTKIEYQQELDLNQLSEETFPTLRIILHIGICDVSNTQHQPYTGICSSLVNIYISTLNIPLLSLRSLYDTYLALLLLVGPCRLSLDAMFRWHS